MATGYSLLIMNIYALFILIGIAVLLPASIVLAIVLIVRKALKAEKKRDVEKRGLITNRSFLKSFIFSILTLGIYDYYLIHVIAHDLNVACGEKDSRKTSGFTAYFFLNLITLGIYSVVWYVKACNRMRDRIEGDGEQSEISGLSWFMWSFFGAFLLGIGVLIARYKLIHALNHVNSIYNSET